MNRPVHSAALLAGFLCLVACGGESVSLVPADDDRDGAIRGLDCDDANPAVHPGAVEVPYNGIDDDCDPSTLDDDADQDTFRRAVDCDDQNPTIYPGAVEVPYDAIDQDCDGSDLDDLDHDRVSGAEDCDDRNPFVRPGAAEVCGDAVDQDCDGSDLPCLPRDDDNDTWTVAAGDCNDLDASVHPEAVEVPYDGVDQDCDPATPDDDLDDDGFARYGGGDCDDDDATVFPGADEVPYDHIDQNCSGTDLVDVDGDGAVASAAGGADCDDRNASIGPGRIDPCGDGIDQDCSGTDVACSPRDSDQDGYSALDGDCNDDVAAIHPGATEVPYSGVDEDCDPATPDDDLDGDGFAARGGGDCDDTDPTLFPGADEIPYDGIDQSCSGSDLVDLDRDGFAAAQTGGPDCNDTRPDIGPLADEIPYNYVDENCDGSDLVDLRPVVLSDAPASVRAPDIAFGGGTFLVVWEDGRSGSPALWGQLLDDGIARVGNNFPIRLTGAGSEPELPQVAYADGTFLVVWTERSGGLGRDIFAQQISTTGVLEGSLRNIAVGAGDHLLAAVAGSETLFAVAWTLDDGNTRKHEAALFSISAGLSTPQVLATDVPADSRVRLASDGADFLAVWHDGATLQAGTMTATGAWLGASVLLAAPDNGRMPDVVYEPWWDYYFVSYLSGPQVRSVAFHPGPVTPMTPVVLSDAYGQRAVQIAATSTEAAGSVWIDDRWGRGPTTLYAHWTFPNAGFVYPHVTENDLLVATDAALSSLAADEDPFSGDLVVVRAEGIGASARIVASVLGTF